MNDKRIEPNQVYTTPEAASLLNISERTILEELDKGALPAKYLGKGWKILGSTLLAYIGTPTNITQDMQPNYTGGAVTQREAQGTLVDTSAMGVPSLNGLPLINGGARGLPLPVSDLKLANGEPAIGQKVELTFSNGEPAIKPKE